MIKNTFYLLTLTVILSSAGLSAETSKNATYLLQVSSNLQCNTLDIELISDDQKTRKSLNYGKGAFAAVELAAGTYEFGDVICNGDERLDVLKGKIAPIKVAANQAYYGGRLIFKLAANVEDHADLDVIENCSKIVGRTRGDEFGDSASGTACRDGNGVATSLQPNKQINVYAPKATEEDLKTVRTALNASEEQLRYLPLGV